MTIRLSFQFLIVVECVFCVVSTPGENKKTPGLGPPGTSRDQFVVNGAPGRHERAAADIVHNTSGNIVTLNMLDFFRHNGRCLFSLVNNAEIRFRT